MEEGVINIFPVKDSDGLIYHFGDAQIVGGNEIEVGSEMVDESQIQIEMAPQPSDMSEVEVGGDEEVIDEGVPEPETHVVIQDNSPGKEEMVVKIFPVVGAYEEIVMDQSGDVQQEVDVSCEEVGEDLDSIEEGEVDTSALAGQYTIHQYSKADLMNMEMTNSVVKPESQEENPLSRMFQQTADRLKKRLESTEQDMEYFTKAGLQALTRQSVSGEGDGADRSRKLNICEICHKSFSKFTKLQKHMKLHEANYEYMPTNPTLDARAKLKQLLESEQDGSRNPDLSSDTEDKYQPVKTYLCGICFKAFSQESRLNKHLRSHKNEETAAKKKGGGKRDKVVKRKKGYQCNVCYKTFARPATLQKHMEIHVTTNESMDEEEEEEEDGSDRSPKGSIPKLYEYECQVCDRTFDRPCNLKYHLYSHEETKHLGVPPPVHICSICDRSFHRPYFLRRHMLSAHEIIMEGPMRKKSAKMSGSMRTSGLIASALSPKKKSFRCEVCDKAFDRPCNLKYHLYSHKETRHMGTPPPVHICGRCGKEFNRPVLLRHHSRYCTMPS